MDKKKLIEHAKKATKYAYAPYSKFKVGAAILTKDNRVFYGANIENVAYSTTICAERVALSHAHMSGIKKKDICAIAIIADLPDAVTPCGECRQVMAEMMDLDTPVYLGNYKGKIKETAVGKLLPHGFDSLVKKLK